MKVTHILYSGVGGHGTVVKSLLEGDLGKVNSYQLIFSGVVPLAEEYRKLCKEWNLSFGFVAYNSKNLLKTYFQVIQQLKHFKPDIIVLHSISLIIPIFLYGRIYGAGIISVDHQTNSFKRWTEWIYSRLILLFSDAVVYLSENYKNEITGALKVIASLKRYKMHVISNGININYLEKYQKQEHEDLNNKYNVSYCSRFIPLKDFDTFIMAAKILCNKVPNKWHFTLAGDGPESSRIHELIQKEGMSEYFSLPGFINQEEIAVLLSESDIYMHTSQHENMSTAILQAMAQGVPVIASDIPGNRVLIKNNETGVLCTPGNPDDFADACLRLMNNPELSKDITLSAREMVRNQFSNETMFKNYNNLAHQLMINK